MLREIFNSTKQKGKIDLNKIIKQKASSYPTFAIKDFEENKLIELKEKKLISFIDDSNGFILPLGYALLEGKFETLSSYNEFELLKVIYNELCNRIFEQFNRDNYTNLDCALGMFILIMGSTSRKDSFPFKKLDKNFAYYPIIEHHINYIYTRLFYNKDKRVMALKDEVMLRNILGRNDKNGNISNKTDLYKVESDRGQGVKRIWFEINNVEKDIKNILDSLLANKLNLVMILNLKKITMDYLLINTLPYEMKSDLGERILRDKVLEQIISYCNNYIDINILDAKANLSDEEKKLILENTRFDSVPEYQQIKDLYDSISDIINRMPEIGLIFVEIHYKLGRFINYYESLSETEEKLNEDIKNIFNENVGEDFFDLLLESKNVALEFLQR